MSEPFLPYETSLLVLRYLYSEGCTATATEFMDEMACLKSACKDPEMPDKLALPSVFAGLNDILNDYGRTKLLVKDQVKKLAQWKAISEDAVSPCDTLTTQLRAIIQVLSSTFGPTVKKTPVVQKEKEYNKSRTSDVSKSVQTSPDASVIRTKKVASTCTTTDGVMSGCWSICSCLHSSTSVVKEVKEVLEIATQTNFSNNEDQLGVVPPVNEDKGADIRDGFTDISEDEDALENDVKKTIPEDENESEITERIEGDAERLPPERAASLFYNVLLEDLDAQNSIANFANHYMQQLAESRDSPVKPNFVPVEIDQFLHSLLSDEPDVPTPDCPDIEMEEGEIADDSQDNVGEFQAAERSLISHFKNSQTPTASPIPITVTVSSPLEAQAKARTVNNTPAPASFQSIQSISQQDVPKERGEAAHSHEVVNVDNAESFMLVHPVPNTLLPDSALPEMRDEFQELLEGKSLIGISRVPPPQNAQPPKRTQTAWQKIGRRSIAPKIPSHQTAAITAIATPACAPANPPDQSPTTNVVQERPSTTSTLTPVNQSNPQSKPGLYQHLIASAKTIQTTDFPTARTEKASTITNTLQHALERGKKCHTTPRKPYVRKLRFNSPQVLNDNENRTVCIDPNKTEVLPIPEFKPSESNKVKAKKTLFPSLCQAIEAHPAKSSGPVPVQNHHIGDLRLLQDEAKAVKVSPKPQAAKQDRKRIHSPDKVSKPCNRPPQNTRTSTIQIASPSPSKKLKTEVNQTKKRPFLPVPVPPAPPMQKPDTTRPSPQSNTKQNTRRNSTSTYTSAASAASQKQAKPEARCSDPPKNVPASVTSLVSSSNSSKMSVLSNDTKGNRRKKKEPEKKPTAVAATKLNQNSITQVTQSAVSVTAAESTLNMNSQEAVTRFPASSSYTDLNFAVPRTPRYKGVVDSDWESQSSENFESIFSQRLPLLTPIKDNDLPITPGKNLDLQRGVNDNVSETSKTSSERKSMFSLAMNAALRRESEKHALDTPMPNVTNTVSQPNKADYMPASPFPQGHGQLVKQIPVSEMQQKAVESQSSIKKEKNPNSEPKQNPVTKTSQSHSGVKQPVVAPILPAELHRSNTKAKLTPHPESESKLSARNSSSKSQSVQFVVAGKPKQLQRLEHATAISLCQLSQMGSPDPKLLMTPRSSPLREVEGNTSSNKLDSNGIEDLLSMLHGSNK